MKKTIIAMILLLSAFSFAGSFKDKRDGQTYKTVKIKNQTWMAENLNYAVDNGYGSWCYDNEYRNCKKYGRLYTYYAAMNACPGGWHLPSENEWESLFDAVGGIQEANYVLRSKNDWYYNDGDRYKFRVLPAGSYNRMDGVMYRDGRDRWEFGYIKQWAIFRTSSSNINFYFPSQYTNVVRDNTVDVKAGTSVRCVKDY
ncbi:MAG: hypothetical protein MJY78_08555 [Fibrobacter sp.]|nr:hypothetical protein [Fibrobacter sp.]